MDNEDANKNKSKYNIKHDSMMKKIVAVKTK